MVASKMLVTAAAKEGKKVQAFPFFGAERRGAPVAAFARIDDQKIRVHSEVYAPDYVIVLDPVLYKTVPVAAGLKKGGSILLNSPQDPSSYSFPAEFKVATVDAGGIARRHRLGSRTKPIEHGPSRRLCQGDGNHRDRGPGGDHPGIDPGEGEGERSRGPGSVRKRENRVRRGRQNDRRVKEWKKKSS